jgi:hypothetical protein
VWNQLPTILAGPRADVQEWCAVTSVDSTALLADDCVTIAAAERAAPDTRFHAAFLAPTLIGCAAAWG